MGGEFTQRTHNPHGQEQKTREAGFQKLPYLLVGVRPVKAQEKVGGLAVQEEICCPERDGKALDSVAEVKRDPEVLGVSICKDVLQEKKGELSARHPVSSRVCRVRTLQGPPLGLLPICRPGGDAGTHQARLREGKGAEEALLSLAQQASQAYFFLTWPFPPSGRSLRHHQRAAGTQKACSSEWLHTDNPASHPPSSEQLQKSL